MLEDSGFAEPTDAVNETPILGGEGDSGAPRSVFERSPMKVLASLANKPLEQAMKAIGYIDSGRERERKILRAVSPEALVLIGRNGPDYKEAVKAIS